MAKKFRDVIELKKKVKLGIKRKLQKSVSIINIQSIILRDQQRPKKIGEKTSFEMHKIAYEKKKLKIDAYWRDLYRMQKIQEEITAKQIRISKYNYAMDREVQNFDCQEAILQISKNGEYLNILNSKLVDTVF